MKAEDKIRQRYGSDTGFSVPDGYFDQVFAKIGSELPERETPPVVKMTRWQRMKPYVYLAAMFAGIWCTMKMVTMIQSAPAGTEVSLDNPPAMIAQTMSSPEVATPLVGSSSVIIVEDSEPVSDNGDVPQVPEVSEEDLDEVIMEYTNAAVDAGDIDINQLQAALDADTSEEFYYM